MAADIIIYPEISIHTLAWRVTYVDTSATVTELISIHTLAWRVTEYLFSAEAAY